MLLDAPFESDSIDFKYVSGSSTLQKTGSFLTVPYSESNFLRQNVASRTININPFHVTTFVGSLKLTPDSDVWVDFETRPVIIQNDEGNLDHLENLTNQQGTEWGNWRTVGQTTSGNTRTTTRRRARKRNY